jgi:hypothetical protein
MSNKRRRKSFRLFWHICGFAAGIILAAIGLTSFLLVCLSIYGARNESHALALSGIFGFLGVMVLLLFLLGAKITRDTFRSMRDHSLDDVDLDKEPWMANEEWRKRRIVHRIGMVPAVHVLWILASIILVGVSIFAVLTVPISVLATALLISCGIVIALGCLYRYLKEKNVAIGLRGIVPLIFFLPALIVLPGSAFGLFSPEMKGLLELVAGIIMVCGVAVIFVYLYLKKRKFGISICHLKTLPAFVGGALEAEIEIDFPKVKTGLPELPEGPVEVELLNLELTGRNTIVRWMTNSAIQPHTLIRPGDGTLRIPVEIRIPDEAKEKMAKKTFWTGSLWKLEIRAPFPGVDYASGFIVPVYLPRSEPDPPQKPG